MYNEPGRIGLIGSASRRAVVAAFTLASLPGLIGEWRCDQGDGQLVHNDAAGPRSDHPNIVRVPEQHFSESIFTKFGGATATDNYALSPDGDMTASRLVLPAGAANGVLIRDSNLRPTPGQTWTVACDIRSNTGADQVVRLDHGNGRSGDKTITTSWKMEEFPFTAASNSRAGIANASDGRAADIQIRGLQLVPGDTAPPYERPAGHWRPFKPASPPQWVTGGISLSGTDQAFMGMFAEALTLEEGTIHIAFASTAAPSEGYDPLAQFGWNNATNLRFGARYSGHVQAVTIDGQTAADDTGVSAANSLVPITPFGARMHVHTLTWTSQKVRTLIDGQLIRETTLVTGAQSQTLFAFFTNMGSFCAKGVVSYVALYTKAQRNSDARKAAGYIIEEVAARGTRTPTITHGIENMLMADGDSLIVAADRVGVAALAAANVTPVCFAIQAATSGSTIQRLNGRAPKLKRLINPLRRNNILICNPGTNDLNSPTADPVAIKAAFKAYGLSMLDAGVKLGWLTVLPTNLTGNVALGGYNATVEQLNDLTREDPSWYTVLIDIAAHPIMGDPALVNDLTLRYDGIHWTDLGVSYVSPIVTAGVQSMLIPEPSRVLLASNGTSALLGSDGIKRLVTS